MDSSNVKVVVRVRPLLPREEDKPLVSMPEEEPGTTILTVPDGKPPKKYVFDDSIWSYNPSDSNYVDNAGFYRKSGPQLITHFFQGYNVCLLAYGQTGSGKTFTMIGDKTNPGIIPLMIKDVMRHKESLVEQKIDCEILFSYVEIYNEKVKDLLDNSKQCRVREHPETGPYVENSTLVPLNSFEEFSTYLNKGNKNRMVASTKMNEASSRSHAVITFTLKQIRFDNEEGSSAVGEPVEEMVSNIKLVDLAGSERLSRTQMFGQSERIKEGSQINKSLTVLGRCINILAQGSRSVIPFRDSTLTYLLRENLAGNSKTAMVFCISPCDFEETHQTLNYASQVKKIKTKAKANESTLLSAPIDWEKLQNMEKSVIDTLKEQIQQLTTELSDLKAGASQEPVESLIKFLEREREKQSFEVKYLKSVVSSQQSRMDELQAQNSYLHQELSGNIRDRIQCDSDILQNELRRQRDDCALHRAEIKQLLRELDPSHLQIT
ncbi:putative kinesin [Clavispora lusitaniae]|uniref:Kinesin n=1 Tax=Clavispora lusitaniae TaxID=36911 RepID=A0AA91T045_CLALS|nr:putative kinesin [Clavispora lusitaniae]